jgi:FMN phosphatase YigB (HAD superfamily)
MIKAILVDFARTLIFPKDKTYLGGVNVLHEKLKVDSSYKLFDHFELNEVLIKHLKILSESIPVYMFTSDFIQEDVSLRSQVTPLFTKVYSARAMGMSKSEFDTYKFIANDLNLKPEEILFIDDNLNNVKAARDAGMEIIHFKDNSDINKIDLIIHP